MSSPNGIQKTSDQQLSEIAKYAYGSGWNEKTKGGAGNIGLLDGKVVKFNTHRNERGGPVTEAMRRSSDELRAKLYSIAQEFLTDPKTGAAALADIRKKLGLNANGQPPENAKLLDRKVVAAVVTKLGEATRKNYFTEKIVNSKGEAEDVNLRDMASTGKVTRFEEVTRQTVSQMAARHEQDYAKTLDEMTQTLCKGKKISAENTVILRGLLRHAVVGVIAESGQVPDENDLKAKGSVFDSLLKLKVAGRLTMTQVNCARSLPPHEVKAFLRACYLVPDSTIGIGMAYRLSAVAEKLSKLSAEKFTPENILKLAIPDLPMTAGSRGWKGSDPLHVDEVNRFTRPFDELFIKSELISSKCLRNGKSNTTLHQMQAQIPNLLGFGVSYSDLKLVMRSPEKFSTRMLPSAAFCSGDDAFDSKPDDSCQGDIYRFEPEVTVLNSKSHVRYAMPQAMREKDPSKNVVLEFNQKLKDLCNGNIAQLRQIRLLMSQNAQVAFSALHMSRNVEKDGSQPPKGTRFIMRPDPETGDVLVSATTNPKMCGFSLSVTIRVGADGSETVVDRQEDLSGAPLTPLDDRGRPMLLEPTIQPLSASPKKKVAETQAAYSDIYKAVGEIRELLKNAGGALKDDVRTALASYISFAPVIGQLCDYLKSPGANVEYCNRSFRALLSNWIGSLTADQRAAFKDFASFAKNIKRGYAETALFDQIYVDTGSLDPETNPEAGEALNLNINILELPNPNVYDEEDFLADCCKLRPVLGDLKTAIVSWEKNNKIQKQQEADNMIVNGPQGRKVVPKPGEELVNKVWEGGAGALAHLAGQSKDSPRIAAALAKLNDENLALHLGEAETWANLLSSFSPADRQSVDDYLRGLAEALVGAEDLWKAGNDGNQERDRVVTEKLTTALLLKVLEYKYVKGVSAYQPGNPTAQIQKQGTNTCPIMSVVNAMLSNTNNAQLVSQSMTLTGADDLSKGYSFQMRTDDGTTETVVIKPSDLENEKNWFAGGTFSDFEKAALIAMKNQGLPDDFRPGLTFEATHVGRLFGKGDAVITGSNGTPLSEFEAWKMLRRAFEALQAGKPCVLRTPAPKHFRAVVGIDRPENGEPSLIVWDSLDGRKYTLSITKLMAESEAQLYVFEDRVNPEREPDAFEIDIQRLLTEMRAPIGQ